MQVESAPLAGLLVLEPPRFGDARGWFSEVYNQKAAHDAGIGVNFVQDNHSYSAMRGTIRGLHYQSPPNGQAKLVRCGAGAIWDVAVDARKGSPTYGKWYGVELSVENGRQLFIPEGFLHGFSTLSDGSELLYKCSDFYASDADGTVAWNSAKLGIDWKVSGQPVVSDKDGDAMDFESWDSPFNWIET